MESHYRAAATGLVRFFLIVITLAISAILGPSRPASAEELTISEVRILLDQARSEKADVFSPGHFEEALKTFNKAVQDSAAGKKSANIRRKLEEARRHLSEAESTTAKMRELFPDLIAAYEGALGAGSPELAGEVYERAMSSLNRISDKLEKGKLQSAADLTGITIKHFRDAELQSIKVTVFDEVEEKLNRVSEAGGAELTPRLYAQARENLREAERFIEADRYDLERANQLVEEARSILNHASFMTEWIKRLHDDPGGWEGLILEFETYIQEISSALHLNPRFDRDMLLSIEPVLAAIRSLQDDRIYLQKEMTQRDLRIGELEAEVGKLREQSGKYVTELETRRQQLREQQRFEDKIARITSLLAPEEGSVVRSTAGQSDRIIIRLTGMKFPSGSAEIQAQDFALLTKVQRIIREFPDRSIEIHGHTDSKGQEAHNQELSEERAESVRDYLLLNMTIPEDRIRAIGFGESRPIASNETATGRNQNRRIEIVLTLY